jgi:hypothetical protein
MFIEVYSNLASLMLFNLPVLTRCVILLCPIRVCFHFTSGPKLSGKYGKFASSILASFTHLFTRLSAVCDSVSFRLTHLDICKAPTGSGKTVLFELAIIRMLAASSNARESAKCVYMAPTKVRF